MLESVEVTGREARESGLRDPREELGAVEELEPVHSGDEFRVAREALRQPTRMGSVPRR